MYHRILTALDGSGPSNLAADTAFHVAAAGTDVQLLGCHVYAARMHYTRFGEMEPGLPEQYQEGEKLTQLRQTHDGLISEGMKTISDAYLDALRKATKDKNISWESITPEGKNYVEFLQVIGTKHPDLVVMGSCGHGRVPESGLGSMAERILLYARDTDLLLVRRPWEFRGRPIVVGIDGSTDSYAALARALEIARQEQARVDLVAVFDPFFHSGVFRSIADALPEKKKEQFNFSAQEKLHDEIIDRGLEKLYEEKLLQGKALAAEQGVEVRIHVLKGKVFSQLHHYAMLERAALLVVGRWGLHRERISTIGSHTLNLARICDTNLLVVAPFRETVPVPAVPRQEATTLSWSPPAEKAMEQVPEFARGMARKAVELYGRENGLGEITPDTVNVVAGRFGMQISPPPNSTASVTRDAETIVLRKIKRLAPDFHRHIVKSRIIGQEIKKGDHILVYEVEETSPPGMVKVTERTSLEFR
ncbi:MAG: universal stress protein [Methanomicrobiales archaeon]|nr:universal stress protein [Methanomicrobiales archaeon]